ncbi:MAG: type ISP restriction/modification enzyme [Ginsengibacter sp.]
MSGIILNDDYKKWFKDLKSFERNPTSTQLIPLLGSDVVEDLATHLALAFSDEKEENADERGNASTVCYADSDEVSEDFKIETFPTSFSAADIFYYIYAVLFSSRNINGHEKLNHEVPFELLFPKNQIAFWNLVKLGRELRQIHLQ